MIKNASIFFIVITAFTTLLARFDVRVYAPEREEPGVTFVLDEKFETWAKQENKDLEDHNYFKRDVLKNLKQLRQHLADEEGGEVFTAKAHDGVSVHGTIFQREENDSVIVIGPGFPFPREKLAPFLVLFPDYDIIFFDYRGQGLDHVKKDYERSLIGVTRKLVHRCFGIDFDASSLGAFEDQDVVAVVQEIRERFFYKNVFGLGLCYSSYIFAKAEAENPGLFDKLILDGTWPTVEPVIEEIIRHPSLIWGKQPPSSPCPCITNTGCFQRMGKRIAKALIATDFTKLKPIETYLEALQCPVLFFQSRIDCYCSEERFEKMWEATHSLQAFDAKRNLRKQAHRVVVFTENYHGRNYVYQREEYKEIANLFLKSGLFIKSDQEYFVRELEKHVRR